MSTQLIIGSCYRLESLGILVQVVGLNCGMQALVGPRAGWVLAVFKRLVHCSCTHSFLSCSLASLIQHLWPSPLGDQRVVPVTMSNQEG